MKFKTFLTLIGLVYLLAVPAARSVMTADEPPPGSYQKSCQNIRNNPLNSEALYQRGLIAECRKKNGSYVQSILAGTTVYPEPEK